MSEGRDLALVRAYHQATKHHTDGYAPSPGFLDWDSQPDPFRRFDHAPVVQLPLVQGSGLATYDELFREPNGAMPAPTIARLGLFLELALGLSAWKSMGSDRWALRNNPSSGNLHPTEGYLLLWGAEEAELLPGLYHYRPDCHALERRAVLPKAVAGELARKVPESWGALGLSSVIWREEWKYGSRAFRYCQHDVGHALGAARFAAGASQWRLRMDPVPADSTVAACLGLDRPSDFIDAEAEHPDLLAFLGAPTPDTAIPWPRLASELSEWAGTANRLSEESVRWPEIARVLPATAKPEGQSADPETGPHHATEAGAGGGDAVALIRRRRSAQRMDGESGIGRLEFERLLRRTMPGAPPFDAFPFAPSVNLVFFAHAVEGLEPGVYFLPRTGELSCFEHVPSPLPGWELPLYALPAQPELRKLASQLSCYQGIAGRGAFSLAMLADFDRVMEGEGGWAYRRLHWECGLIGQVLYLEAEAAGLRGTGIGCFFDDAVHRLLGVAGGWQDLYHFAVGRALEDKHLTTDPPYASLSDRARV